jgi:hypothetical protein
VIRLPEAPTAADAPPPSGPTPIEPASPLGRPSEIRNRRRFALRGVVIAGVALPNATLDCWEDVHGGTHWSVRVLARPPLANGRFAGLTPDGRLVSGDVRVVGEMAGPGRMNTLFELLGLGPLDSLRPGSP